MDQSRRPGGHHVRAAVMTLLTEVAGRTLCAGCCEPIDTNTASRTVTVDGETFEVHHLGPCRRWLRESREPRDRD
jgi:hypothetical protein